MHVTPSPRSVCGFERLGIVGTYGMGMKGVASNAALKGTDTKKNQLNHASKIKNIDAKLKGKDRRVLKAFRPIGSELLGGKGLNEGGYGEDAGPADGVQSAMEKDVNGADHVSGVKVYGDNSIEEHSVNENVPPKEDVNNATNVNGDFVHGNTSLKFSFTLMFKNATVDDNTPLNEGVDNVSKENNDSDYVPGSSSPKSSFASMFKNTTSSKAVKLTKMKSNKEVQGANAAIPLAAVEEISTLFQNTLYGYFIGKRLAFFFFQFATHEGMERVLENGPWLIRLVPIILNIWTPNTRLKKDMITSAPVWDKIHHVPIVAFSEIGLSLITSQLGRPIMLDAYRSSMCQKSWGRNMYVRALIIIFALSTLKDYVVVAIPFPNGTGHSLETVKVVETTQDEGDDFIQPSKEGDALKSHQPNKEATQPKHPTARSMNSMDEGINMLSLRNSFETLKDEDKFLDVDDNIQMKSNADNDPLDDDEEEVEEVYHDQISSISVKPNDSKGESTPYGEVIHSCVYFKAKKKELFCSFVYAHNRYTHRDALWQNLVTHKGYIQNWTWCILGDFNVSLHVDEKSTGSSYIDTGMRDFQECVDNTEVSDVNSTGLRFTWNQKPKEEDGILKKIDRIMANLEFCVSFVGSSALFQPYRISNQSLAVLRSPMNSAIKPRPFKFYNILVHNAWFKELLYDHGNIHDTVDNLRHELDEAQKALNFDLSNLELWEEEVAYLQAFNDALLMEERFLMQKAKVEWLKFSDANTAYFHKVVKSQASRNRIDSVLLLMAFLWMVVKSPWLYRSLHGFS
ncbi:RNA-directed DNA polymerase, eukaryota, reverse transcriptase zinc-binding domain protein [Tanacetum coccineum]